MILAILLSLFTSSPGADAQTQWECRIIKEWTCDGNDESWNKGGHLFVKKGTSDADARDTYKRACQREGGRDCSIKSCRNTDRKYCDGVYDPPRRSRRSYREICRARRGDFQCSNYCFRHRNYDRACRY